MENTLAIEQAESTPTPNQSSRLFRRITHVYATWLVLHPVINVLLIVIFLISTVVIALCFSKIPFFDDPTKEFITIGTPTMAKLYQLKALQQNTLSVPTIKYDRTRGARSITMKDKLEFCFELPDQGSDELWSRFDFMSKMVVSVRDNKDGASGNFLATPGAVESLCRLQSRFESLAGYTQLCSKDTLTDIDSACCPIWSLANFIASIVGKTSCHQIAQEDVKRVGNLYETCRESFLSGALKRACWDNTAPSRWLCPEVPPQCFAHPHLLLLLATAGPPPHYRHLNGTEGWNATVLVLPLWRRVGVQFWRLASLGRPQTLADLTRNLTPSLAIEAIELGAYGELTSQYVAWDSTWLAMGAGCLALLLLLLTRGCIAVVIATFVALGWSLILSYGLYARLFIDLPTFSLLNMMALVLLLGLGADDILLFYQVWVSENSNDRSGEGSTDYDECNGEEEMRRVQRMAMTLHHAVPSVCLTSLSTLGGLLVSLNSSIVAVKRFAVYASFTVVCHVVYVLVVMPTILVLFVPFYRRRRCCPRPYLLRLSLAELFVIKVRFVFPVLLFAIIFISAYLLFYAGWLAFPTGSLQPTFYQPSHPVEIYRLRGGEFSWAEYVLRRHRGLVSLHVVWGVHPHDPRNHWTWTPDDDEGVVPQPRWRKDFNLNAPESLAWLSTFCSQLTKMPYFLVHSPILPRATFLEESALLSSQKYGCAFGNGLFSFQDFVKSNSICSDDIPACLSAFAEASSNPTGLRFALGTVQTAGLVISTTTNFSLANATFSEVQDFAREVETWFSALLGTAPSGLVGGFLVSPELAAFETYQDVLKFLPLSLGLSVALAAVLVLLSTLNLPLAIISLISVVSSLLLSCFLLVALAGWSLGIVEALIFSLSAGLAVDPCIHLAFAIIRSDGEKYMSYKQRCQRALETVGWAVTGAAVSTALAGSAVLPSQLMCYRQMGLFLLILMMSALLLCGVAFVGSVACLPDRCLPICWRKADSRVSSSRTCRS